MEVAQRFEEGVRELRLLQDHVQLERLQGGGRVGQGVIGHRFQLVEGQAQLAEFGGVPKQPGRQPADLVALHDENLQIGGPVLNELHQRSLSLPDLF